MIAVQRSLIPSMTIIKLKHRCWLFIALLLAACTPQESIEETQSRLTAEHGVVIRPSDPGTFYIAPYGEKEAKLPVGKMFAANLFVLPKSLRGIEDALSRYPKGFVASLIKAIFISGELWFDGKPAGGTYHHSWIIVASTTNKNKESNYEAALYGVHHKLSSFVLNKQPITGMAWGELMPQGWSAATSYAKALGVNWSDEPDYVNGFLSKYAETSVENDFNTYAEFAFSNPAELVKLANNYPLIAKKLRLFIDAYSRLSPVMARGLNKQHL